MLLRSSRTTLDLHPTKLARGKSSQLFTGQNLKQGSCFILLASFALSATVIFVFRTVRATGSTYYSQGNLPPNLISSWNTLRAGGGSTPPNFTSGDIFVIQGTGNGATTPHSMTTNAPWTVSGSGAEVQVENGAALSVANGTTVDRLTILSGGSTTVTGSVTLTVNNGNGAGADLSVAGTLSCTNPSSNFAYGSGATGQFLSGGKFVFGRNGGGVLVVPIATWDSNSTLEITGVISSLPSNLNQAFGNFTWNCANQTANLNLSGNPSTISGNF